MLTASQIEASRGQAVKDTLRVIQNICQGDLLDTINSIQPILSMCKPGSDIDIDKIKNALYQFGEKEMSNLARSSQNTRQSMHSALNQSLVSNDTAADEEEIDQNIDNST